MLVRMLLLEYKKENKSTACDVVRVARCSKRYWRNIKTLEYNLRTLNAYYYF